MASMQPQPRMDPHALDANEMNLREHLLAAQAAEKAQAQAEAQAQAHGLLHAQPTGNHLQLVSADGARPHDPNIDPAISGSPYALAQGDSGSETTPDGKRGKRELSQSKRAAQNRAAQRAFRQRKEGYIKQLEDKVRNYSALEESFKQVQNENYQLRDYVISLQSRLIESQGDFPQPPPAIDLQNPREPSDLGLPAHISAPTAHMGPAAVSQLQAAAAAAAQAGQYASKDSDMREEDRDVLMKELAAKRMSGFGEDEGPELAKMAMSTAQTEMQSQRAAESDQYHDRDQEPSHALQQNQPQSRSHTHPTISA